MGGADKVTSPEDVGRLHVSPFLFEEKVLTCTQHI